MYTLLFILALVAALLTLLAAVFTLGAIFSMATECHIFNKKSRFFVPKVLFFVLLIVVDALFFPVIGHKNWNLMLPLGIALVLLLSYYSWLWSKHGAEKWNLFFVHIALLSFLCLTKTLNDALAYYEWKHAKIYVVQPIDKSILFQKTDTLYIFNDKIITKPN